MPSGKPKWAVGTGKNTLKTVLRIHGKGRQTFTNNKRLLAVKLSNGDAGEVQMVNIAIRPADSNKFYVWAMPYTDFLEALNAKDMVAHTCIWNIKDDHSAQHVYEAMAMDIIDFDWRTG